MRRHTAEPSNAVLLEAIENLGKKQNDLLEKLVAIEQSVSNNSIANRADLAVAKSSVIKDQVTSLKTENKQL